MGQVWVYAVVLAVYLGLQFVIGVLAGRRIRGSSEGFHLGGRSVGPWVTALSFVAAYFSSVVIVGGGGFGYRYGMGTVWIGTTNVVVGTLLAWIVLGQRTREMTYRLGCVTLPEFLGKRYGISAARWFSAAVIGLFLILYGVSVLQGMGQAFAVLMGLPYVAGLLLSSLVILVYVAVGGYLAVVWTGFFQALVMMAALVLLTVCAIGRAGGLAQVASRLAELEQGRYLQTPGAWTWTGLWSYALIVSFGVWGMPQLVSRFYSIRSTRVLRLGTVLATAGGAMALLPYFNGALSRIFYPSLAAADQAIPLLVKDSLRPLAAALFLAGVIAAGMSTFAAILITASGAIVRDLLREGLRVSGGEKSETLLSRQVSVIIGLVALVIAVKPPAMILVITGFSWAAIAACTLWPYVLGLYWRRGTAAGAMAAMVGGVVTALAWMALKNPFKVHGFVPGMVVNLLLLVLVSHFSRPPQPELVAAAFGDRTGRVETDSEKKGSVPC